MKVLSFEQWSINEEVVVTDAISSPMKKVNFLLAGEKIEGLTGKNNKRIYGDINEYLKKGFYRE